ncbi:TIGR04452 family lipoprotein [Leptospira sp. 96542]|nr:TIGR04452 family lipoprotein [Leptospira sp. 96542]
MLKKILFVLLVLNFANCLILNPVGLTADREKGSEAASRITNAAIQVDLIRSTVYSSSPLLLSVLAADIAKIETDKYYIKTDVDQCVSDINGFQGLVLGSPVTVIISCQDLQTDGYLTGEPFPSF